MQRSSLPPINEVSYGIVPLRKALDEWLVLLVQSQHRFWGLPKGHPELGETPRETAKRELLEETGLTVVKFLSEIQPIETYTFYQGKRRINKQVFYFIAEVEGDIILQKKEMLSSMWIPLEKAESFATYSETKKVLSETLQHIQKI